MKLSALLSLTTIFIAGTDAWSFTVWTGKDQHGQKRHYHSLLADNDCYNFDEAITSKGVGSFDTNIDNGLEEPVSDVPSLLCRTLGYIYGRNMTFHLVQCYLRHLDMTEEPRVKFEYSNLIYSVLSLVIETPTARSLGDVLR
ncbi:hypothetical protein O9K51_11359 [Purpureocillium lavendulum]|uniref:Uncharacterized protein n=1 Tax=Purpureocillium lavendulum TaxID=1247861 RepID=A0AB34FA82_9HYPO|nr:hypothetical protein O9K51_11488 [Purpureocillium lavendulum]KAJ6436134.1 hypothetical protein O9K51_11359 [Purpureocillium lavendulum]